MEGEDSEVTPKKETENIPVLSTLKKHTNYVKMTTLFYYKMANFFTWGTQWATLSKMPNNLKPHINSLEATVSF